MPPRPALALPLLLLAAAAGPAGCARFPAFPGGEVAATGDYPALLPLELLLARGAGGAIDAGLTARLEARGAALRARAAALRGPVIEPPTRARMAAALARAPR